MGSMVTGDLEGHFIDVCMSCSFRHEIRGKDSGSNAPKRDVLNNQYKTYPHILQHNGPNHESQ